MADMDLDLDLDGPSKAPTRRARFAPKSSKLKPQPETKPKPETLPSSTSVISSKKEELDSKKEELDTEPSVKDDAAEVEDAVGNGDVSMDGETAGNDDVEEEPVAMETDSGEDEVVREIDVFFTPSLDPNTKLYVLQYPLRPVWRPYELEERCQEVRLRPSTAEVEVDLALDIDSKNFDQASSHAEKMKKQILSTSWIPLPTCTSGYAVGVLIGDKLHLNPVHAVAQLRPSQQHLKESELKKKNIAASNDEETIKNEEIKEKKPVGPSKKQNKPPGTDKDIGEDWVHLQYHGARSDNAARYLNKMALEECSPVPFSMSPVEYLNALCPGRPTQTDRLKNLRTRLSQLPLEERYRTWLLEGPPIHRFDALKHLAPDIPVDEILRVLQKYAQLVQGLWVPKSSLVHGTDDGPKVLMRDFVLFEFSKGTLIKESIFDRSELFKFALPALMSLAIKRPDLKDWKLKEQPDKKFQNLYGDIVKEQQATWERMGKTISGIMPRGRTSRPTRKDALKPNANVPALPSGSKPTPTTLSTATSMSEETREALPKWLKKIIGIPNCCSLQQIRERLRNVAVESTNHPGRTGKEAIAAAKGADVHPDELHAVINQVAFNIHGVYVLKSLPGNSPEHDALRKVVIDLFIAGGRSAKLKKASIVEAAKLELKREITNAEFQKVMQEVCVSKNTAWVLKCDADGNLA